MLSVQQLSVKFNGKVVVSDSSFSVERGNITAIVGESGSGKSVTVNAILNMLPENAVVTGEIIYLEKSLSIMKANDLNELRKKSIFTIFQDAQNSFNPSIKMEKQLYAFSGERLGDDFYTFKVKMKLLLDELALPISILDNYPFELSGGMLQRCMIACSLYVEPDLLIADEPTSGLDMLIQKEFISLLRQLNEVKKTTIILITHDIEIVRAIAHKVVVMKEGKIVEKGMVDSLFQRAQHTYTKYLLDSRFG